MSTLDPERWRAASAELDVALDLDGDARTAFLASLRQRNSALAADVERLLDEHRAVKAADFLGQSPSAGPLDAGEDTRAWDGAAPSAPQRPSLGGGANVGPYRILRPLGRGGMGVVYEADEIDSGRRVALKVLEEQLNDERERERFDREGRLAASIDHPHCVFVFAARELDGRPAIAMELMEGTLADRLKAHGPLPPTSAIDATVQLVAGLQAAASLGILHRDVKPSNCFVDAAGTIKIGDFGISRSLRPTEETALSTRSQFAATPAYASPEQLRGASLDVRADIYSLGATLYELLTGRRPFERPDLMSLLMAVANDPPTPPHRLVPGIPKGLSRIVMRCLAKRPEARFATYDALVAALEPYSSVAPSPATVGRRVVAGIVDHLLLMIVTGPLTLWWMSSGALFDVRRLWVQQLISYLLLVAYFGAWEGARGATPGKAALGLTLVDPRGRPASALQAVGRAIVYSTVFNLTGLVWMFVVSESDPQRIMYDTRWASVVSVMPWVLLALDFSTARRRNGYAAVHDLVTRSRIVERSPRATRRAAIPREVDATAAVVARRGPFDVFDDAIAGRPPGWRHGFDRRLRRPVWVRDVPPGTAVLSQERVGIGRPTRLRWLAGRRQADEAWDVFEAVAGLPLAEACARPRPWAEVRWWLLDLARECAASGDRAILRLDRVWVLDTGGAKIVDDPAIDKPGSLEPAGSPCASLLLEVSRAARQPDSPPWTVGAHAFMSALEQGSADGAGDAIRTLETLSGRPAGTSRGWRALSLAGLALVPLMVAGPMTIMMKVMLAQIEQVPVDVRVAARGLRHLEPSRGKRPALSSEDRAAIEHALATDYRHTLTPSGVFAPERFFLGMRPEHRAIADDVLRRHDSGQAPAATKRPILRTLEREATENRMPPLPAVGLMLMVGTFVAVACGGLLAAVAFRGGLMRLLGLEIATSSGRPASRLRVLARAMVAWSPLILLAVWSVTQNVSGLQIESPGALMVVMGAALAALLAGGLIALIRPERGIQDWIAGTWVVPR